MALNARVQIPSGADLNTYTNPGSYVSISSANTQSLLNCPPNVKSGAYLDVYTLNAMAFTQIMRQWGDGVYSVRSINKETGLISEWVPYAPATPPEEYDLPLAEGISNDGTGKNVYWKDQFNQVHILLFVSNQNPIAPGGTIATLPAGFRPSAQLILSGGILFNSERNSCSINVYSNGELKYYGDPLSSGGGVIFGTGCFVASS